MGGKKGREGREGGRGKKEGKEKRKGTSFSIESFPLARTYSNSLITVVY
jgi:hypothetical protein